MQNQKQKIDIGWMAGLFEGEGNIYRNDKRRIFVMAVKMKDEDIVKRFHGIVQYGRVRQRIQRQPYCEMWEWVLTRTNEILLLCHILLPFMGKRRTELIRKAIDGKTPVKERQTLKEVSKCGYMTKGELSTRGAKKHIRNGEKPCIVCAENQRLYLRRWRKAFYEANK